MNNFKEIASVTLILFSIIDILGSIPIIIDLRKKSGKIESGKATIVAGTIMIAFLFVGDSAVDMQTAAAAGMHSVGAGWGF